MLNRHRKETRNLFLSPMTEPSAFFCSFSPPLFQLKREFHYLLVRIDIHAEQQTGSLIHINTGYGAVQYTGCHHVTFMGEYTEYPASLLIGVGQFYNVLELTAIINGINVFVSHLHIIVADSACRKAIPFRTIP